MDSKLPLVNETGTGVMNEPQTQVTIVMCLSVWEQLDTEVKKDLEHGIKWMKEIREQIGTKSNIVERI